MITTVIIELFFKGIGYSLFLYGIWRLVGERFFNSYIRTGIMKYKNYRRLKRYRELNKQLVTPRKSNMNSLQYLEVLLTSVSKTGNVNISNFIMLSIIIFIVSTTILYLLISDLFFSIIMGILFGLCPYFLTIYRLEHLRIKTQSGFLNEFHIILQNYQSSQRNIYYGLYNAVNEIKDKDLKRQIRKLLSSFQKDRSEQEFKRQVHIFVYSINSTFAKRFGSLIIKAHLDNFDISKTLNDLSKDISERKKGMEDEKTKNLQTVMLGFAPLFVFPICIFFAYQITGVRNFWHYFSDSTNLTLFVICLISSVVSILIAFLKKNPKADI